MEWLKHAPAGSELPQTNALVPQPLLNGLVYAALIVTGLAIVPLVFLDTFTNLLAVGPRKPLRQTVFGYTTAVGDQFEFALAEQPPVGWCIHILGSRPTGPATRPCTPPTVCGERRGSWLLSIILERRQESRRLMYRIWL